MQNQSSPLKVVINPPDILLGMPGDTLQLHVIITNQGNKDAKIFVDFDEAFQNLNLSNNSLQECLSLADQKSYEVSFEFQIPTNTPPGTYDYRLIVDAPDDYPEETPISFPLQIQVLIKEQTVRRGGDDPTFTVKPATNPNNPLIYKPGQPLQLVVTVNNHCQQVDRFRLTCPDLDETWFTIRYLKTGFEGVGLLSQGNGLELNDYSQGEILLEFHPPGDAFAGTYPPTIRLHSQNRPDLILLDLVYITIPEVYSLDVELNTILGISRIAGKYELKLTNRGNTIRELLISAKTQDEEQLCNYKFEPSEVKLLPTKSIDVNLTAKPLNWWRRPWFGSGLVITFQTEIKDQKQLPLPNKFSQGTLVWKARPWWQFLLLILLILGILGGTALIIWRILHPPQAKIDVFKPTSPSYVEGNRVSLDWQIRNTEKLDKLKLFLTPVSGVTQEVSYDLKGKIPQELNNKDKCQKQNNILNCNNIETEARKPGKYNFKLEAYNDRGIKIDGKEFTVSINLFPVPSIVNDSFKSDKPSYQKGEQVKLTWQISNQEYLANLQIKNKQENGTSSIVKEFDFSQGIPPQLQKQCQKDNNLTCQNILMVVNTPPGKYTLILQPVAKSAFQKEIKPSNAISINVTSKPFGIEFFGINDNPAISQLLEEGTTVNLGWKVTGDPQDVTVILSPSGKEVNLVGSEPYLVLSGNQVVGIKVTDKYDGQKSITRNITIAPKPKIEPTPTTPVLNIPQPAVSPTPPSQNVTPSPKSLF